MNNHPAAFLPPVHPGEILLEEFKKFLGLSQSRLAMDLRIPVQRLHDLIHGRRGLSLDTAARLARYFGSSAQVWLNLQARYDLEKAEDQGLFLDIAREVTPRSDPAEA